MEFVITTVISFLASEFPQFFLFVPYLYNYLCTLLSSSSVSPLFTCVTFCFCILRKVGLEWRCWRCVFYRRCRLFRAGEGHPLQYRDVMVMTSKYSQLQDDVTYYAGRVTSPDVFLLHSQKGRIGFFIFLFFYFFILF